MVLFFKEWFNILSTWEGREKYCLILANRKITTTLKFIFLIREGKKEKIESEKSLIKTNDEQERKGYREVSPSANRWPEKKFNLGEMEKFVLILEECKFWWHMNHVRRKGPSLAGERIESKRGERGGRSPMVAVASEVV